MSTSPKKAAKKDSEKASGPFSLTERESQVAAMALVYQDGEGKLDFPKIANKLNLENPRSISNVFSKIKRKVLDAFPEDGLESPKGKGKGKKKPADKKTSGAAEKGEKTSAAVDTEDAAVETEDTVIKTEDTVIKTEDNKAEVKDTEAEDNQ
ncbi:hypothetical protein F4778DRAFT_57441 [Xylariomycetidae sp. FL2044]|nr:hypothetical protein F4778DRAFT_57441 [Xylariomycetidae sp. FL2044]